MGKSTSEPTERRTKRDEPWTANYPPLAEWLEKVEGRCLWQTPNGTSMVEGWAIGSSIVILTIFANGNGWNIYTACRSNRVDLTLQDAEMRCGYQRKDDESTVKTDGSMRSK